MTSQEWQFWADERERVARQFREAMDAYVSTIQRFREGGVPASVAQEAISTALESLELCRKQVEWTRQAILKNLS